MELIRYPSHMGSWKSRNSEQLEKDILRVMGRGRNGES
ncbi:unnamed protein product [Spirodela intermedia]|uniref:Uncharacterized protein n=1 Tax=Spirodela intermedia TaxID=51605 RepID=A0A7I8JEV3_SPIIN|nr:unnamed protein product [Spirodela intermedia]CAA6668649.1 unnamed protein product [Spirodela intermedia]